MPTPQPEYLTPAFSTNPKARNLTGMRFGRLFVISMFGRNARNLILWKCVCDCDPERKRICTATTGSLIYGDTRSCGCLKAETLHRRSTKHGQAPRHGRSPTYSSWTAMIARCTRPTAHKWLNYGGRGIKVCDAWLDFEKFFADMGEKPKGTSLDRKDVEGNYEKSNCQWADAITQAQNHRMQKNNTSGYKGIHVSLHSYVVSIGVNGKSIHLGCFPLTPEGLERAKAVRLLAEDLYFGGSTSIEYQKPYRPVNNKTGVAGLYICLGDRYIARWTINGKKTYLGRFPLTPKGLKAAAEAVRKAKQLAELLS